jgi:hypothetical protein
MILPVFGSFFSRDRIVLKSSNLGAFSAYLQQPCCKSFTALVQWTCWYSTEGDRANQQLVAVTDVAAVIKE